MSAPNPAVAIAVALGGTFGDQAVLLREDQSAWRRYRAGQRDPGAQRVARWAALANVRIELTAAGWTATRLLGGDR